MTPTAEPPGHVACPYCLATPGEPCRSHKQPGRYPDDLDKPPVLTKHPHIERVVAAQRR